MAAKKNQGNATKRNCQPNRKKKAGSKPESAGLYIVGIGASAGGIDAFEKFFKKMPGVIIFDILTLSPFSDNFAPESA